VTTAHLIFYIILTGLITGTGIYLESMRRGIRATKVAERKRRAERERKARELRDNRLS
jgi:hypothetical protein